MNVVGPCCRCITYPSLNIQLGFIHASNAKFLGAPDLGCVLLLSLLVYVFYQKDTKPKPSHNQKVKMSWRWLYRTETLILFWNNQEYPCILRAWAVSDKVVHGLPVLCALFVDKQRHSADCALVTGTWLVPLTHHPCFSPSEKLRQKQCSTWQLHQWEVSRVTVPLGLTQFKSISIKLI